MEGHEEEHPMVTLLRELTEDPDICLTVMCGGALITGRVMTKSQFWNGPADGSETPGVTDQATAIEDGDVSAPTRTVFYLGEAASIVGGDWSPTPPATTRWCGRLDRIAVSK